MEDKDIDWTSKRIQKLNVVLSCAGWGLVALTMVWEVVSKGTLDLTGGGNVGIVFMVWFMGQLFYAYKRDQQRFLDRLEANGLLKEKP